MLATLLCLLILLWVHLDPDSESEIFLAWLKKVRKMRNGYIFRFFQTYAFMLVKLWHIQLTKKRPWHIHMHNFLHSQCFTLDAYDFIYINCWGAYSTFCLFYGLALRNWSWGLWHDDWMLDWLAWILFLGCVFPGNGSHI